MPVLDGLFCLRCGDALPTPLVPLCRTCRLAPPPFEQAVSFGPYQGRLRDAIHLFKYNRVRSLSQNLGWMLAAAIAQLESTTPRQLTVIPIPLHRSKLRQRGFNQALALAQQAIAVLRRSSPGWQLTLAPQALVRRRRTESQPGLTTRQRRLNLRNAFAVPRPALVSGQSVLLIDDILTTGATARSATTALLKAGAAQVWVATLVRAQSGLLSGLPAVLEDNDTNLANPGPAALCAGQSLNPPEKS